MLKFTSRSTGAFGIVGEGDVLERDLALAACPGRARRGARGACRRCRGSPGCARSPPPSARCVLLIFARSCTGLKNFDEIGEEDRQRADRHDVRRARARCRARARSPVQSATTIATAGESTDLTRRAFERRIDGRAAHRSRGAPPRAPAARTPSPRASIRAPARPPRRCRSACLRTSCVARFTARLKRATNSSRNGVTAPR